MKTFSKKSDNKFNLFLLKKKRKLIKKSFGEFFLWFSKTDTKLLGDFLIKSKNFFMVLMQILDIIPQKIKIHGQFLIEIIGPLKLLLQLPVRDPEILHVLFNFIHQALPGFLVLWVFLQD